MKAVFNFFEMFNAGYKKRNLPGKLFWHKNTIIGIDIIVIV